jgi:hypothetical protein
MSPARTVGTGGGSHTPVLSALLLILGIVTQRRASGLVIQLQLRGEIGKGRIAISSSIDVSGMGGKPQRGGAIVFRVSAVIKQ